MNINKAILAPLIAAIALFVKQAFGYEISQEWQDAAINIVLFAIMVSGVFMHPKKKETVTYDYTGLEAERISAED